MSDDEVYPARPDYVVMVCADFYGINESKIFGREYAPGVKAARAMAASLIHSECGFSWDDVAEVLNRSRHSHAVMAKLAATADPADRAHILDAMGRT